MSCGDFRSEGMFPGRYSEILVSANDRMYSEFGSFF